MTANEQFVDEMRLLLEDKIMELIGDFEPVTINVTDNEWAIYGVSHTKDFQTYVFRIVEAWGLTAILFTEDGRILGNWDIEKHR